MPAQRLMSAVVSLVPVLLVISGRISAAQDAERTVSVAGTAVTMTVPDLVRWRLSTSDLDKDLLAAKGKSDAKLKAILGLREELGVAIEDVQTGHLSIRKEWVRDRSGNPVEFKGFVITRTIAFTQRDIARFDEFLAKFVSRAEVELEFSFDTTRRHALRNETRLKALAAAKQKAADMTAALVAGLGKVLTIKEEQPSRSFQTFASNMITSDEGDRAAADVASGTMAPGSIEVRVTVHASFAIE